MNAPLSAAAIAIVRTAPVDKSPAGLGEVRKGTQTLKRGSESDAVKDTQKLMNDVGGGKLKLDGKFGSKTEGAVREFQTEQRLKRIDGKVGPETLGALERLNAERKPAPAAKDDVCPKTQASKRETASAKETQRQAELAQPAPAKPANDLVKTGIVAATGSTANEGAAKEGAATTPAGTPASAPTAAPNAPGVVAGATLSRGQSGEQVREVQTRLRELGYATGPLDGKFGPITQAAVRKFQSDNGLATDGVVGPQTSSALKTPATRKTSTNPVVSTAASPASTPTSVPSSSITPVNQADGGGTRLGTGSSTLRSAGCMLSAYGMAAQAISDRTDGMGVKDLNSLVKSKRGFSGSSLRGPVAAKAMGMTQTGRSTINGSNASSRMRALNESLAAGNPVVLGVDYKAGSRGSGRGTGVDHWITVTGRDPKNSNRYLAIDPAGGRQISLKLGSNGMLTAATGSKRYVGREMITFQKR